MKAIIKTVLRVICIIAFVLCTIFILPKAFSHSPSSADGMGAMMGVLLAYFLFAAPGMYAIKAMFFPKNKAGKEVKS